MAQAHKFRKAKSLFSTTLSAGISTGTGETITPASVTGLPTDCEITLTVDRVDSTGTATPTKMERITGIISAGNLTAYTRGIDGSTEQAHSSGAVVEYIWNADDLNDLVDGILVNHAQTGHLKSGAQIDDTTADHQYILGVSELTADRTITLPLLTGNDDFVFEDHAQTLTNKTLTSPTLTTPVLSDGTTMTTDGGVIYDRTNEKLLIGDGTNTQSIQTGVWKTWTPSFTGFSSAPSTPLAYYTLIGKLCLLSLNTGNGTSNATNFLVSLPFTAASTHGGIGYGQGIDSGAYEANVLATISAGGTTVSLTLDGGGSAWTNSGDKGANIAIYYEVA